MLALLLALSTQAIPAAPVSLYDLVTVSDLSGIAPWPDGRWIAFRTEQPNLANNRIETRWYVAATDGSAPARALFDGGAALHTGPGLVLNERPVWLPDNSAFLVRAPIDGAVQVWRVDLGGETHPVTESDGDVLAFSLAEGGATLVYSAAPPREAVRAEEQRIRDQGARVDGSVDLAVGVVGGGEGPFGPKSVRLNGQWFDRKELLAQASPRFFRQSLAGQAVPSGNGPVHQDYVLPDPKIEAAICQVNDCRKARIEAIVPIPGSSRLLVTTADPAQRQTLNIWDGRVLVPLHRAAGLASGGRVEYQPCGVTGQMAICVIASADQPPRLDAIDLASGEWRTLFDPNEALRARTTGRARTFSWADARGNHFEGQLFLPAGRQPARGFPLVVQYYWCEGFLRGGQGDELPFLALAARGVAALCVNRSLGGRPTGRRSSDLEVAESGVGAAIDRLASAGLVDRMRVGMQGLSFGSEATMWIARNTNLLRAASISSGQFEPMSYWFYEDPTHDFSRILKKVWGLGDPQRNPRPWRAEAGGRLGRGPLVPLLMQLPESEARWSLELFRTLQKAEVPVELYAFPGAAHVKAAPRQLLAASERNLAWFLFWLKGEQIVDPSDPERIARWETASQKLKVANGGEP